MASYAEICQRIDLYDKIGAGDSGLCDIMRRKKQEEILLYIGSFHPRAVSQAGGTGRFAGYWQTRIGSGRADSKLIRAKTLEELLKILAEHYGIKTPEETRKETLEGIFEEWLDWKVDRNGNKEGTREHNRNCFNRYVAGTPLSKTPIVKVTTEALDEWARETLKKTPLSSKRFNTLKLVVTGPLDYAVRQGIIAESPWKPVQMTYKRLLKSERKAPSNQKLFYDDEVAALVRKLSEDYEKNRNTANMALILNFDLGLRVGELAALKWEDVDWKRKSISIRRQESEGKVEDFVKSDSAAGYRELPLSDRHITLLKRVQFDTGCLSGFIFTDEQGQRKTAAALKKRLIYVQVGKGGDCAGSHVKRIHCQRRTVGTKIAKDKGLEAARQWLGHTDLMTTLRYIYTTETIDSMRDYIQEESVLKALDSLKKQPENPVIKVSTSVI